MRKIIIQFILLLAVFGISVAKAVPAIDAFTTTGLTTDGKILVSNTTSTSKDFFVRISRPFSSSTGNYESVSMSFHIIYRSVNGEEELTSEIYVGTSDFNGGAFFQGNYQISIPAGRVGGAIHIRYYYTHMETGNYVGPELSSVFFQTTDTNPTTPWYQYEGSFFRDISVTPSSARPIYTFMDGNWRHIQTYETLVGVYYNYPIRDFSFAPSPIGSPIGPSTYIIRHTATGKMYFREGNVIRHIYSVDAANKYRFKLSNPMQVTSISSYVVGPTIY